jgi:hypothetical protein
MPVYCYRHKNTGEIIEVLRPMSDSDKPYIHTDGVECIRDFGAENGHAVVNSSKEFWERFPNDVKTTNPKYVRSKDGQKIKYDPTKHC